MTLSAAASPAAPGVGLSGRGLALILLVSLGWGLNWPMMKLVLNEVPVWTFRALSLVVCAAAFFLLALLLRLRVRPRRSEFRALLPIALFNIVAWHLLSGYGISLLEAGRAGIIAFTMPLWAALLGALLLRERLERRTLLGLALGLAGVLLLLQEDFASLGRSPLGTLAMVGAAIAWALGTVLIKRAAPQLPLVSFAAWQFALAAPVIVAGALLIEGPPRLAALSTEAWLALAYVLVAAMLVCQLAWYSIVRILPAAIAGISTLAIPVVGLLSSALLLGEPLGWRQGLALLLVGAALAVVLVLPALARRRARALPPVVGLGG